MKVDQHSFEAFYLEEFFLRLRSNFLKQQNICEMSHQVFLKLDFRIQQDN